MILIQKSHKNIAIIWLLYSNSTIYVTLLPTPDVMSITIHGIKYELIHKPDSTKSVKSSCFNNRWVLFALHIGC